MGIKSQYTLYSRVKHEQVLIFIGMKGDGEVDAE